jgi:hypothetical protein
MCSSKIKCFGCKKDKLVSDFNGHRLLCKACQGSTSPVSYKHKGGNENLFEGAAEIIGSAIGEFFSNLLD